MNDPSRLIHEHFPVGPLQCNCSVIGDALSKQAIVVDPGGDPARIMETLGRHELKLVSIIHTHAHLDHILAAGQIKAATGASVQLHPDDRPLWDMLEQQCQAFGLPFTGPLPEPDRWLRDDDALDCCGGMAMHTPGHTPGSMSFWFEDDNLLLAGDTLFQRSVGRTDLPGGSFEQLRRSITERLYSLDDGATVITGHGPATTIGEERQMNPFVRA